MKLKDFFKNIFSPVKGRIRKDQESLKACHVPLLLVA